MVGAVAGLLGGGALLLALFAVLLVAAVVASPFGVLFSSEPSPGNVTLNVVRKIDPHGNIHTPVEFIDIMEREHMISMVDFTMLRQACELIQRWKPVWPDLVLNVNFSRNTLMEPDFLERIDQILSETGDDPAQLIFEITESSQNIQLESLHDRLDEVKKRGISLAIDDLGTEAACLEMLYLPQISVATMVFEDQAHG